jgi:hypothetical protein
MLEGSIEIVFRSFIIAERISTGDAMRTVSLILDPLAAAFSLHR